MPRRDIRRNYHSLRVKAYVQNAGTGLWRRSDMLFGPSMLCCASQWLCVCVCVFLTTDAGLTRTDKGANAGKGVGR